MITAGIDVGTKDSCVIVMKNDKIVEFFKTNDLRRDLNDLIEFLRIHSPKAIGCGFGYGLPVKRLSDVDERDLEYMTLSFDKPLMGVRRLINALKEEFGNISFTIPSVKLLPTVPHYRKFNRIDMGTSDKVCSTALAITKLRERGVKFKEQNFVLVEGGYGFNAFVAVKEGKIVDGSGGTSGFISFSSSGALDAEIVTLLKDYPKDMIFRGGLKDFLKCEIDSIPRERLNWIFEYILKGIKVMEVSIGKDYIVILSGRFFDSYYNEFVEYSGLKCLKLESVKASAEGACIIANGLINGIYRDVVEHLELKKAKGNVLDYIAEDLRNLFKYDI